MKNTSVFGRTFLDDLLRHVVLVILIFCTVQSNAQDFTATMKAMQDSVRDAKRFHIVMDVSAFENSQSTNTVFHDKFDVNKEERNYSYQYSTNELLMNKNFVIMVDKKEREIHYSERNKKSEKDFDKRLSFNIDSMFSVFQTPEYIDTEDGVEHFSIVPKKGTIAKIDLFINKKTSLFSALQYVYKTGALVKIHFDVFDLHPIFSDHKFDEKNYIVKANNKYLSTANFRSYKIVEN